MKTRGASVHGNLGVGKTVVGLELSDLQPLSAGRLALQWE